MEIVQSFQWTQATDFAEKYQTLATMMLFAYVPTVLLLKMLIVTPFQLELPLKLWNICLSGLSFYGFSVLIQRLFHVNFIHSINNMDYSNQQYGYIVYLFCLSKFPEMVDTFFIVLRKKQLTFLHVFHHLSVALYCWSVLYYPTPLGYWFALMNTFVHGVMYGYFAFDKEIKK